MRTARRHGRRTRVSVPYRLVEAVAKIDSTARVPGLAAVGDRGDGCPVAVRVWTVPGHKNSLVNSEPFTLAASFG